MARVKLPNQGYGFIDTTGKLVIPCNYAEASDFKSGSASVKQGASRIRIDRKGNKI
jgi:hypothetical protein